MMFKDHIMHLDIFKFIQYVSVVICCYCQNTSPAIVLVITTRSVKTADLHESDSSEPSGLILSIITEEVEAIDDTVEAEEIVDAREVHEDILEAMHEGTKGEEYEDRDRNFVYMLFISV